MRHDSISPASSGGRALSPLWGDFFKAWPFGSGFFTGGGADVWESEWDWIDDKGEPYETRGDDDSTGLNVSIRTGYRFVPAPVFFIEPGFQLGHFFNDSELGLYGIFCLAVGALF